MREMPHRSEHLTSTIRHGSVSGVAVGDRNDPVPLTPNAIRPVGRPNQAAAAAVANSGLIDAAPVSFFVDARIATSFGGPLRSLS
jgi:hypothetical protein